MFSLGEKVLVTFLVALVVFLVLIVTVYLPMFVHVGQVCAEHGWPTGTLYFNMDKYCTREINETEYICPLEMVVANECVFEYQEGN